MKYRIFHHSDIEGVVAEAVKLPRKLNFAAAQDCICQTGAHTGQLLRIWLFSVAYTAQIQDRKLRSDVIFLDVFVPFEEGGDALVLIFFNIDSNQQKNHRFMFFTII